MTVVKRPGRPVDNGLVARRSEEILDAAIVLFAEHGFANADTQALADRLGVGKGTLYRYFPSKQELFLAAADRVMRQLQERVNSSFSEEDDPLARIPKAIQAYLGFFEEHPEFVELLIQERANFKDRKQPTYFEHREANSRRWQDVFRSLIAAGRVRELPVERLTEVLGDLVYGTMFTNYFTRRQRSLAEQADRIVDIVFHGILTDAERKRFRRQANFP